MFYYSTCLPDRWNLYYKAASYYSPGICPSGMTNAGTPPSGFGPPVETTETAIVCCPSSWTFKVKSKTRFSCLSLHDGPYTDYYYTSISGRYTTRTTTYDTTRTAYVYPIQVRWAQSDLPILETDPLTPGAKYTGQSTPSAETGPSTGNTTSGGLSTGAKIGIGIGAAAVFLGFIIAVLALVLRHHRRQSKNPDFQQQPQVASPTEKPPPFAASYQPQSGGAHPHAYNVGPMPPNELMVADMK